MKKMMNCSQTEKRCSTCHEVKPASEYGRPKRHTRDYGVYYYLPSRCLECDRIKKADDRGKNPDKFLEWNRAAQSKRVTANRLRPEVQAYWDKKAATAPTEAGGVEVRACAHCGEVKMVSEFRAYIRKDGVRKPTATCKECTSARVSTWRAENKERIAVNRRKATAKETPERAKARASSARARRHSPQTEEDELYMEARRLTELTGVPHEVDHVLPLNPRDQIVCGLHLASNLRVVPAAVNLSKGEQILQEDAVQFAPLPPARVVQRQVFA